MTTQSLPARVWATMSSINVNDMTEKKGNLTYLSWASAVEVLSKNFPDNDFHTSFDKLDDGTVMTYCNLTIRDGERVMARSMWLPVMDHRNNAIQNPDARKISDAMMRCLAKCISVSTGLGLYIYRGEDLPTAEVEAKKQTITEDQALTIAEGIVHSGTDKQKFCEHYKVKDLRQLTVEQFDQAIHMLNKKIAQNAATEQQ
jgi:hypothetical protein